MIGGDVDVGGAGQVDVVQFGFNFYWLEAGLFLRLGHEGQNVLVIEAVGEVVEIGSEIGSLAEEADVIGSAARFLCELLEKELAPMVHDPAATDAADARFINSGDEHAGALCVRNGGIEIRIVHVTDAVVGIEAIVDHENFVASVVLGPVLDEISEGKVRTGVNTRISEGQANGFCRRDCGRR